MKFSTEYFKSEYGKDLKTGKDKFYKKEKEPVVPEDITDLATDQHFAPLRKRSKKISKITDDIIAHQEWERDKEREYN